MSIFVISQLAEYPIAPLSTKHAPFDITYKDQIKQTDKENGKTKLTNRYWRVYCTTPIGRGVYKTLINLLQLWDKKDSKIFFNKRQFLLLLGQKASGAQYSVLINNLNSLTKISVESPVTTGTNEPFKLFSHINLKSKECWIQFSESFHILAMKPQNQYYLPGNICNFNKLPLTAQKLSILLGKWDKHNKSFFKKKFETVCTAIPIQGTTKRKRKQQLKIALQWLEKFNLIESSSIAKGTADDILEVSFIKRSKSPSNVVAECDIDKSKFQLSLFLGKTMKAHPAKWNGVVKNIPSTLIAQGIANAQNATHTIENSGDVVRNKEGLLMSQLKEVALENNITLPLLD